MSLPTSAAARKAVPIFSGVLKYFPDAIAAVAHLSMVGNEQHNPGSPLHWDRSKSGDELDAMMRHVLEAGTSDTDGIRHSTKAAWRALANLQKEIERDADVPVVTPDTVRMCLDEDPFSPSARASIHERSQHPLRLPVRAPEKLETWAKTTAAYIAELNRGYGK